VLTAHPVRQYRLIAVVEIEEILTAVVFAPDKTNHKVGIDDKLGNGGGIVIEIRKDAIVVDEPGADQPVTLTVEQ